MKIVYNNNYRTSRNMTVAFLLIAFSLIPILLSVLIIVPEMLAEKGETTAVITSIEEYYDGDNWVEEAFVDYAVNGITYNHVLLPDYSYKYREGMEITVHYLIDSPETLVTPSGLVIAFIVMNIVSLALIITAIVTIVRAVRRKLNTEANPGIIDQVVDAIDKSDDVLTYVNKPTINSATTLYFHRTGNGNKNYVAETIEHRPSYNITKLSRNTYEFHNVESGSRRTHTISSVKIKEFGNVNRNVNVRSFKIDDIDALEFLSKRGIKIESHVEDLNWFDVKYYNSSIAYIEERDIRKLFDSTYHNYSFAPTPGSYKIDLDIDELDNVMLAAFVLSIIITTYN